MRLSEFINGGAGCGILKRLEAGQAEADAHAVRLKQIQKNIKSDEAAMLKMATQDESYVGGVKNDYALADKLKRLQKQNLAQVVWRHKRLVATDEQLENLYRRLKRKQHERLMKHKIRR
ncbi:hypothetical protein [Magnetovibrio blakemorei]|uniref:Uncharacterized protein n=1 Tax=Magnetovibrio blakemorei TaxID=28181 RepID=A0A1E5Q831_9PROT|nr:hypothetical protein [Magnetovibrio blakemorei]OEJ67514.1 hypothetical protein BEN30_08725 [Magnetovibrio blakemorei]